MISQTQLNEIIKKNDAFIDRYVSKIKPISNLEFITQEDMRFKFWNKVTSYPKSEGYSTYSILYTHAVDNLSVDRAIGRSSKHFVLSCYCCCDCGYTDKNNQENLHNVFITLARAKGDIYSPLGYFIRLGHSLTTYQSRKRYADINKLTLVTCKTKRPCCTSTYSYEIDIKALATKDFNNRYIQDCFIKNIVSDKERYNRIEYGLNYMYCFQTFSYIMLFTHAIAIAVSFALGDVYSGIGYSIGLIMLAIIASMRYSCITRSLKKDGIVETHQQSFLITPYSIYQAIKENLLSPEVENLKDILQTLNESLLHEQIPVVISHIIASYLVLDYKVLVKALPKKYFSEINPSQIKKEVIYRYSNNSKYKYQSIPMKTEEEALTPDNQVLIKIQPK